MKYDLIKNERLVGETYEEYRKRRKIVQMIIKNYLKGKNAEFRKESTEESSKV